VRVCLPRIAYLCCLLWCTQVTGGGGGWLTSFADAATPNSEEIPKAYWDAVLPGIPMPPAIINLLLAQQNGLSFSLSPLVKTIYNPTLVTLFSVFDNWWHNFPSLIPIIFWIMTLRLRSESLRSVTPPRRGAAYSWILASGQKRAPRAPLPVEGAEDCRTQP
jgi:hypothetical protein